MRAEKASRRVQQLKNSIAAFTAADTDESGEVDVDELLAILPSTIDFAAAAQLMGRFDANDSGGLDRGEFLCLQKHLWSLEDGTTRPLSVKSPTARAAAVASSFAVRSERAAPPLMPRRRVDKATARKANLRRKQMKAALNAFLAADTDGSGEVELEELIVILPAGTDRTAAEALMKEFDADGDGGLDRAEFIRLQKHLWAREDSPPRLTEAFVAQRGFRGFHPGYIFTTRRGKTGYYVDADRALGPGDALAALAARLEGTTSESQALVALAATLAELHRAAAATSAAPGGDPVNVEADDRWARALIDGANIANELGAFEVERDLLRRCHNARYALVRNRCDALVMEACGAYASALGASAAEGGDPNAAYAMHGALLASQEQTWGSGDPRVLATRCKMARLLAEHGNVDAAIALLQECRGDATDDAFAAQRVATVALDAADPVLLRVRFDLATLLMHRDGAGETREALMLVTANSVARVRAHTDLVATIDPSRVPGVASIAEAQARLVAKSVELLDLAARCLRRMATLNLRLERSAAAKECHRQLLTLQRSAPGCGAYHPSTIATVHALIELHEADGELAEVERLTLWSFDGHCNLFGFEDERTVGALAMRGRVMRELGMPEAEGTLRYLVRLQTKVLGEAHGATMTTIKELAALLHGKGIMAVAAFADATQEDIDRAAAEAAQPGNNGTATVDESSATAVHREAARASFDEARELLESLVVTHERLFGIMEPPTVAVRIERERGEREESQNAAVPSRV